MREQRGSDTNSGKTDHRLILEPDLPPPLFMILLMDHFIFYNPRIKMSKAELFLYPDYKLSKSFRKVTTRTRCIRIIEFELSIKKSN